MITLLLALAADPPSLPPAGTPAFAAACLVAAQKSMAMRPSERADTEAQRTDVLAAEHWSDQLAAQAEPQARRGLIGAAKAELDDALAQIDGYYSGVRLVNLRQAECQYARRTGTDG